MSDFYGANLSFDDFDNLLKKDDLVEEPVDIQTFVTDNRYLGLPALSDIQVEIARHMTQIFKPETLQQLMGEEEGLAYYKRYTVNEVVAQLGKGSGKDHTTRVSFAYVCYLLHCLRDPLAYYGKAHGVTVDLINLAVNAKQAQQVFFDPLKKLLLRSPWALEAGFEPRVSEVFWFDRPVRLFSGHSESEGWEGYEVLLVVLDEISAFKTDVELKGDLRNKGSATQIYDMSRISVASRFPAFGKVCLLSFPRFRNDFIQQRYNSVINDLVANGGVILDEKFGNKGLDAERSTWALKAATWEVNPTRHKEEFEDEFRRDPVKAKARFMCDPPEMEDAYFRDPDIVRSAFTKLDSPMDEEDGTFKKWFIGTDGFDRFIHVDLGQKRDRCSLAMVHSPGMKEIRVGGGHIEHLPIVNMDLVYYWEGSQEHEVPFSEVRRMIVDLARKFNVVSVTFDQWQSVDMIQGLKALGINADLHGVRKTDYDTFSTAIYDKRFRGYWSKLLVEDELLMLKLFNNTKIDHPTTGTKDLADSVVGATFMCISNTQSDIEVEVEIWEDKIDYDELTSYDFDEVLDKINESKTSKKEEKPVPEDVQMWLDMI